MTDKQKLIKLEYMRVIRVEPAPRLGDILEFEKKNYENPEIWNGKNLNYMGSGKAAISIILEYLRSTSELPDKMAEVLVPSWIGNPVYHQVNWYGFPVLRVSDNCKVIIIYHQYGFPQDMDRLIKFAAERNLIVIEDCAHAPKSLYNGKACGSFGRFAIYSFSKFAFCYALGGVAYTETLFAQFIRERLKKSSRIARRFINALKIIDEANLALKYPILSDKIAVIRKAAFGVYGDAHDPSKRTISMWQKRRDAELFRRQELYMQFRSNTDRFGICSHLDKAGIVPYTIPIRLTEERLRDIVEKLTDIGVRTSINHFDFNRCLIEPDFRKTVLIPCHGDLTNEQFDQITDVVLTVAKGSI